MATRPELHIAVAKQKSKASDYNENFEMMMDYCETVAVETTSYIEGYMPSINASTTDMFLKNDGTEAEWFDLYGSNNTFTGNNTFSGSATLSGDVTISGGTFDFPKCTVTPTTTSTASGTLPAVVVENYVNGDSWFRVYSDNFCEQGGYRSSPGSGSEEIDLLKTMANTNYSATACLSYTGASATFYTPLIVSKTTSKLTLGINQLPSGVYWRVSGYCA